MSAFDCVDDKVKFDEACVNVISNSSNLDSLWLYSLSTNCLSCPYTRLKNIRAAINTSLKFNTVNALKWRVLDNDGIDEYVSAKNTNNIFCELSPNMGQYGLYELAIGNEECNFRTLRKPTYPYTELFVILGIIVLILFGISGGRSLWYLYKRRYGKDGKEEATNKAPTKRRVRALDTFRGATGLTMVFISDGAGSYSVLEHTSWNGMLLADLIFPCFMWIMGVCIPVALSAQLKRGVSKLHISLTVVKRGCFLFLIGVSLNTLGTGAPNLENIRIFGVLQRFGITYLVVSLMYLGYTPSFQNSPRSRVTRVLRDVQVLLPQWSLMIIFVMIHCGITFGLAVPGCPTGYLGPGGLHEDGKYFNCTGGAAGYIDRVVLTLKHLYMKPTPSPVYRTGPFDSEGILGCITTIFQVFLGAHAGIILIIYKDWKERVIRWLLWALLFSVLGCALHFSNAIPVNKNLWSLSFVFVTTALALVFLSACYLLIDVIRIWRGGPFRIPGMNPLVIYVGHMLCYQIFPFHWRIGDMDSRTLRFIESIWPMVLWGIITYIMHRKRTYIKL